MVESVIALRRGPGGAWQAVLSCGHVAPSLEAVRGGSVRVRTRPACPTCGA